MIGQFERCDARISNPESADPFAKTDDAFGGDPFGAGSDPFGSSSDPFGGVSEDETTEDAKTTPEVNLQWGDYKVFGVDILYCR